MKHLTRSSMVVLGAASLLAATLTTTAGAASMTGVYNSKDAAMVPSALKGATLQVATDASYPPDEYLKGTAIVGFDLDLMKAIATTLGLKYKENNVTFDTILSGIDSGRYQVGNSSFTDEKSREKQANFVDYFQAGEGVYVKKTSTLVFKSLQSFCGYTVAVESGTSELTDAQAVKCSGGKKVKVLQFATQNTANLAVSSGQAQFGFLDSQVASYVVSISGGAFKLTGKPINVFPYGIATAKTPSGLGLAKAMLAAFKTMVANGSYHAILAKWGVTGGALSAAQMTLNGAKS